jgi:hypothetical protein
VQELLHRDVRPRTAGRTLNTAQALAKPHVSLGMTG